MVFSAVVFIPGAEKLGNLCHWLWNKTRKLVFVCPVQESCVCPIVVRTTCLIQTANWYPVVLQKILLNVNISNVLRCIGMQIQVFDSRISISIRAFSIIPFVKNKKNLVCQYTQAPQPFAVGQYGCCSDCSPNPW